MLTSCLVIRPGCGIRSVLPMGGGLSRGAVERLEALDDGDEAVAFLRELASCGRSSYTLRTYALGLVHFLGWLSARTTRLADVERGDLVAYVAEFARSEVDDVAVGRAAATVNHSRQRARVVVRVADRARPARRRGRMGGRREPGAAGIGRNGRRARDAGSRRAPAWSTRRAAPAGAASDAGAR